MTVLVMVPDFPVTVTVYVPVAPVLVDLMVRMSATGPVVIVTVGVASVAVGPFLTMGLILVERLTVPVNPLIGVIVMVEVALFPRLMVRLVGEAVSEKSGGARLLKVAAWTVSGTGETVPFANWTQRVVAATLLLGQPVWKPRLVAVLVRVML